MPPGTEHQDPTDAALVGWRQGDCVLGEYWFAYRISPDAAISEAAKAAAPEGVDIAEDLVAGFAVLTQTCDIIRPAARRPYLEIAPLVQVDDQVLREVERGYRPNYAFLPGLADSRLVVDLDRVMTVEKAVVAGWERVPGCSSDQSVRNLSHALARKRARFAFPDDFSAIAKGLEQRLLEKHDRQSKEGEALRSLQEIRVQATPSWNAEAVALMFFFIRNSGAEDFDGIEWSDWLVKWLELIPPDGRYQSVDAVVVTLDDLLARDYVESEPLDLDFVTIRPA